MIKQAKWITSPIDLGARSGTFQKIIHLDSEIKKATLKASAIGIYNAYINGKKVSQDVLTPGWTVYKNRVQYQTYDVSDMLTNSTNCLQIKVGQGWAVGCIGFHNHNHFSSPITKVICAIEIEYKNGEKQVVLSDEDWEVYTNEVLFSELYHGETIDKTASIKLVGNARISPTKTRLIKQVGERISEQEILAPKELIVTKRGERVLDFGQNMTGYMQVRIQAERGKTIQLDFGEVLDSDGNFYNANYRSAQNLVRYVCSGNKDEFKPLFSFQGFRYVKITCDLDNLNLDWFRAIVVHSDMERTGDFECGNAKINQLYHNIIWGQKSNYLDVPTDCPQRDERLGWTGDAQVFCKTAAINYNVKKFFHKWLSDMRLDQTKQGAIPPIVPNVIPSMKKYSAGWADACCICPWEVYLAYDDKRILKENYTMMKKWVNFVRAFGPEEYLWLGGNHYGDWLAMDAGEDEYVGATSTDLIASVFYANSVDILIKAGKVLGKDVTEYERLYANIRRRFYEYFMPDGMPKPTYAQTGEKQVEEKFRQGLTQTAFALILHFNLCKSENRKNLADALARLVKENGNRMTTGFLGTPYILHALSENGYTALAFDLLFQEKSPSWLYSVNHGATTMWEHWNSIKEDGSFWSTDMNSFNHYAYGAVYDWIFTVACGVKIDESAPGYKHFIVRPNPDKRLGYVNASIKTKYGVIASKWRYENERVLYEIVVPSDCTATIILPSGQKQEVGSGVFKF